MFKVGDFIPARPETINEGRLGEHTGKARVSYIHPEGRFYTLEFKYSAGVIRESRFFTAAERELGTRQGLFTAANLASGRPKRGTAPPGYIMADYDDDDPFCDEPGGHRKVDRPSEAVDAALLF